MPTMQPTKGSAGTITLRRETAELVISVLGWIHGHAGENSRVRDAVEALGGELEEALAASAVDAQRALAPEVALDDDADGFFRPMGARLTARNVA